MSDATVTYLVLAGAIALFTWDRLPVALVAVAVAISLWATGVLGYEEAIAGFGDPTVVFIASLFVVSEGLAASGVTAWVGRQLIVRAGSDRSRLLAMLLALVAVGTALINVNGAVAALIPVAVAVSLRLDSPPSRLLLPLAFAAHAGSLLALTGTPVNVIVSEASRDAGAGSFGFFEFALVGLPLVLASGAFILLFGERLVPSRKPRTMAGDFGAHALTLVEQYGLEHEPEGLLNRTAGAAEVVIPPRSDLISETVFAGMSTESGELIVLAVQREGATLEGEAELRAGDVLLLGGDWAALDRNLDDPEVLVVDSPAAIRRGAVPLGPGARRAIAVLAGMVVLLVTGAVPAAMAGLLAAAALVLLRVLDVEQCYRAISWTTVVLIAGMIPLSTAMIETGAAGHLAEAIVDAVGSAGPHVLLLALALLTVTLGQLISNTATALIVIPIAVSAAAEIGVSPRPVLMAVAVAAAASFLTPVATPANLMVMGPGGYRFGDYWRLGLPLLALFVVAAVFWVPLIWGF